MKLVRAMSYVFLGFSAMVYVGCNNSGTNNNQQKHSHDRDHDDHDDDHDDHDHDDHDEMDHHAHGPHHGELIEVADADFSIEVCSTKGEDFLTIYILKKESEDLMPIQAERIIAQLTKGREARTFDFIAEDANEEGLASKFVVNDDVAVAAYNAFGFEVEINVEDQTYKVVVPKNPH